MKITRPVLLKGAIALTMGGLLMACQPKIDEADTASAQVSSAQNVNADRLVYPVTTKGDVVDTYFGQDVPDPFRWLEDDRSPETQAWVAAQNITTQEYLQNIPYRNEIADVVRDMLDYERVSAPFKEGDYTYFYKNDGLQNQSVVYRQKDDGQAEIFLDPNGFSEDGTVSLAGLSFTNDGTLAAYQTSTGGSDWREITIINTTTMEQIGDTLKEIKFSGMQWYKNAGIYYSSYDKPEGSELSEKTDQHKLYFHELNTPQAQDVKVFGHSDAEKHRYIGAQVSDDNRYLMVSAADSTSGNRAFLKDLSKPNSEWMTVKDSVASDVYMLTNVGSKLYFVTNHDAPNTKIVMVDASEPNISNWKDVISETDNVLVPSTAGGFIFAKYMVDAISKVYQYDLSGKQIREVTLPDIA